MKNSERNVVILGAGPAGLTAAYQLAKDGVRSVVLEKDSIVGGISRTVNYKGYHFDIGGHRFFTKVPAVEKLWREMLPAQDFLYCRRTLFSLREVNEVSFSLWEVNEVEAPL